MAAICTSVHSFTPTLTSISPPSPAVLVGTSRLSSSSCIALSSVSRFPRCAPAYRRASASMVVCMAPDEERLTRRNPLDFPVEWERPKPGRRPDIFPQFSPMKTPLPPPLPYDPPAEDEEEEEEENKEEEEEDPDKEQAD
ncbi:splicing factor, arginine/serine-rich 19-like [Cynara cardunculus var. scolymus]|uniref:Uncharacterized protein n=1 Tax=Cynara cardunculus var. scolymus TaxID=59895 RepID=A0A118K734_CYNCS|nr:splicing factor, arginine/serine-rich 19-like [Cynara cardunculus var. scolymus]KVI11597.1 hypothetical protein Ccrd_009983 [Cynara cardunculus var. scolymus]